MTRGTMIDVMRRKAFALAGDLAGKGDPAYRLLHDMTGLESLSGQSVGFWSELVDRLEELKHRRQRSAPPSCTPKQWRYITRLREKLGMDDEHWQNFLKKQLHLDHERFLTVAKARGAITGLKKMVEMRT
ncbi:MAG: hypothetical protein IAF00_03510 [Phycisphaerales bacterium]|nr:hypothetical protein [Phycisphaerales bacterium]